MKEGADRAQSGLAVRGQEDGEESAKVSEKG